MSHWLCATDNINVICVRLPEFSASKLLTKTCCNRKAATCFKLLSQADIENARKRLYFHKTETQQTQYILDKIHESALQRRQEYSYTLSGHEVCEVCFRLAHGLQHNHFNAIKDKFLDGIIVVEHGKYGRNFLTDSTIRVISWLRTFVQKVGDRMPTKEEIHLSSCLTRADVFARAVDDLSQGGLQCCSLSIFYGVWKAHFSNVKIPKVCRFHKRKLYKQHTLVIIFIGGQIF